MEKQKKSDWFDLLAYLLMTVAIVIFILGFVRNQWDILVLINIILMVTCVSLLISGLRNRKMALRYRQLLAWMKGGELEDRHEFPEETQEELKAFFDYLDRKYSYENLKTSMEYSALQNQINPHFLYNTLDAIRSQALEVHAEEIAQMTGKLSRFFRYSIKNQGELVTLEEELANVEDYFSIQHYRFEDRFTMEILCDNPEAFGCYLPKMTFQPIVENALYHGLEPRKGKGRLTLRIHLLEKYLQIIISDDGRGMDDETMEKLRQRLNGKMPEKNARGKRTGIAIYNVNKRLRILFGDACGLQFSSMPGMGTDVEIRIPRIDEESRGQYPVG